MTLVAFTALTGNRASAQAKIDFAKDILPIFDQSCVKCHGPEKQKGKFRLDNKEALFKKDSTAVIPNDAAKSDLYRRIILPKGHEDIMPNEGEPLSKPQTDLVRDWINQGAVWPDGVVSKSASSVAPSKPKNEPLLPKDFKPGDAEAKAIAKIGQAGVDVRPVAMSVPWREANFRLQGSNITDTVIAPVKDVTSLVELNLANTKVTDAGLLAIKALPYLQRLHLELTGVTDAGLANLKGLTNLVYLNLYGTAVSDAGLEHLAGLRYLRNLYVWQSKVTEEGAAKLKKALPELSILTGWDLKSLEKKEEKPAEKSEKKEEKKEDKK